MSLANIVFVNVPKERLTLSIDDEDFKEHRGTRITVDGFDISHCVQSYKIFYVNWGGVYGDVAKVELKLIGQVTFGEADDS